MSDAVLDEATGKVSLAHEFLDYRAVDVHFIYGFLWKSTVPLPPDAFLSGIPHETTRSSAKGGWVSPLIHERIIGSLGTDSTESPWICTYQPTFILGRRCFEKTGYFPNAAPEQPAVASLIIPLKNDISLPLKGDNPTGGDDLDIHPIGAAWTLRLFGTGAGTFTVRISLTDLSELSNPASRFRLIHRLLRLVPNVDLTPEGHHHGAHPAPSSRRPITDAFFFTPELGTTRLFDLMRHFRDSALATLPGDLLDGDGDRRFTTSIRAEETGFAFQEHGPPRLRIYDRFEYECWEQNQSPFTFITVLLSKESLKSLREPSIMRAKELGSIYARLTTDNRSADRDFRRFTEEYLRRALHFDELRRVLPNYSHDGRMYFSFCRRGAVAATATIDELPALFVVPSLLNLFEIIRARLLAGLSISSRLTDIANRLAMLDPESVPIDQSEYAQLRNLVVANLENPLEYLFDGGSATEMAWDAEEALFVRRTWDDVRRSFDVVDRLMSAWDTARFKKKYGA